MVPALLVLLFIMVASTATDSIVIIVTLNRLVRVQHEVCMIHERVKIWETITSAQLHVQGPLLSSPPAYCASPPG